MKWRKYIILIILLSGWCKAGAQELPLTHFTSNSEVNALPSALVSHILQDRQGYMWFTVYTSGLVQYDGSRMEHYDKSNGLRDLGVWQMVEDGQGHLWVSSNGGVVVSEKPLHEYVNGQKVFFTIMYKGMLLSRDPVSSNQKLAVDSNGSVWVGTRDKGIIRYRIHEDESITSDTISTALYGGKILEVNSLAASGKGSIFAGLEGGILTAFEKDRFYTLYTSEVEAAGIGFTSLYEDPEGGIWVYRENGEILHFQSGSATPAQVLKGPPSIVTDISSLEDGSIMAGNGETGIYRIFPETGEIKSYTRANGLLNENVYSIFEDRENNVWIAQSGGVSKLRYNFDAFENYSARFITGDKPVLPSGKINTVLISGAAKSPCKFWVGTEGGATCVDEKGSSIFVTQAEGLTGDWVNGLALDKQGRVWIATTQGLNAIVFDKALLPENSFNVRSLDLFGQEAFVFSLPNSPPFIASENLKMQSRSKGLVESLWFPGKNSLFAVINGEFFELGPRQGLPLNVYISVAFDKEGHLWVGTRERGLYRSTVPLSVENIGNISQSENTVFKQVWSLEKGAPTNHIEKLLFHRGRLWAGTQLGLFVLDPENLEILHHINRTTGLPADNAVSFALSPVTGHLWVGTNHGLAEVAPETGKVIKTVNKQDGLIDNEVWLYGSVKLDKNGNVYYGTSNGLSIYYPERDHPNKVPPQLQLTSAEISYQKDSRNEVNFEYAALSFANVADVRYSTRLLGYDNNWSPPSEVKRLRYTNLPAYLWPKKYTLEVMATNESGVAADKLQYIFEVKPVWWLQWWTFVIYLFLLAAIIFTVDKVQRRRLIKRERDNARIREAELQAETANARSAAAESEALALQAENEKKAFELKKARELEKAYNELKMTQNQLIQAEKMASLGRLATGVAHEIKNPLNFINNFAELTKDLVEELEEARKIGDEKEINILMQDLKENTSKIEKHGKRADAIVRSMMQHARGGESVLEMYNLNALVNDYIDLAYRGKLNQYPELEVSIKKDFDTEIGELKMVRQEVGQVLLNVIGNSLDAVLIKKKEKGEAFEPVVKIQTRRAGEFAEIIISDNGPGVPDAIKERIFEPFFTTKPTGEGTGLGLSLSYNIITQGHNGSLRLENSEEGEGAMFIIALPIYENQSKKKVPA